MVRLGGHGMNSDLEQRIRMLEQELEALKQSVMNRKKRAQESIVLGSDGDERYREAMLLSKYKE